ncbi:uncharacterized protein T551_03413 [Pneumocystis jirovecii RU7]|uniref:Uncharacterized protein n=1 Tax=Pneumocystis jirovecii (strain RU7) TaxID=1408657 RepID=A0A0W4ZDM9_PNEJ7|nr:uncharacterized protein T551_03413 [Pneumocystis jirovecii RU7]KTW26496.1 hypothetical protein T551_03413 [Pneumocystis jirovecii RU7]
MSLDEISIKRKERLNELKKIKISSDLKTNGVKDVSNNNEYPDFDDRKSCLSKLPLSFRNYDPELRRPRIGFENSILERNETVEHEAQKLEENVDYDLKNIEFGYNELDISGLTPKEVNSDLKRLMQMKIDNLKGRTEIAISKLIRERLLMKSNVTEHDCK